ncbi:hypothetical protein ElyMa_002503900 [Elysia marginata]|uniref:Uncharacterized protein n=1 Tax=Elysia marginata TaxID=1093978 RepID=A0AAV4GRC3_9GAST|nr:hypothetical protein ElyMa_002503900 [Elysia marginata]
MRSLCFSAVCLTVLFGLSVSTPGLEFTLSRTKGNLPGTNSSCGVLLCKTFSHGHADDKQRTMTTMSLYKAVSQARQTNRDSGQSAGLRRLATVSSSKPNLEHVSNGMKITGSLKNGQAFLKVNLSRQADCLGEYSCEIQEVDSEGKEMRISSWLVQQSSEDNENEFLDGLTPSLFRTLFSLVQSPITSYHPLQPRVVCKFNQMGRLSI